VIAFSFRGREMGSMSLMHWLVVLAIVLVLFGAGKLPRVMGDFAKGIKAFKAGMKEEDEEAAATPPAQVTAAGGAETPTPAGTTPAATPTPAAATPTGATTAPPAAAASERPREHA
jgi:sec-independent protein translocase protein TatA